jgi:hypothetical protein
MVVTRSQAQKLYCEQESNNLNSLSDPRETTRRSSISTLSDLASDLTELSGDELGDRTLTKMENSTTLTGMYATFDLTLHVNIESISSNHAGRPKPSCDLTRHHQDSKITIGAKQSSSIECYSCRLQTQECHNRRQDRRSTNLPSFSTLQLELQYQESAFAHNSYSDFIFVTLSCFHSSAQFE